MPEKENRDAAPQVDSPVPPSGLPVEAASKKVGRPRKYTPEEFIVHRKQYMKDWRAKQK